MFTALHILLVTASPADGRGVPLLDVMGHDVFWIVVVCAVFVLGVGAAFACFQDVKREKENMSEWQTKSGFLQKTSPRIGAEELFYTTFNKYHGEKTGAELEHGVDTSGGVYSVLSGYEKAKPGTRQKEELTLLEERLITISGMVKDSNNMSIMPSVEEMHNLSLQRIESKLDARLLNICVACVLVCGICGTLWSVHHQINHPGATVDMGVLRSSLRPSMAAVVANVILVVIRARVAASLDSMLEQLDSLTLSQFIPALQPQAQMAKILADFRMFANNVSSKDSRVEFWVKIPLSVSRAIGFFVSSTAKIATALKKYMRNLSNLSDVLETQLAMQNAQIDQANALAMRALAISGRLAPVSEQTMLLLSNLERLHKAPPFNRNTNTHLGRMTEAADRGAEAISELATIIDYIRKWQEVAGTAVGEFTFLLRECRLRVQKLHWLANRASNSDEPLQLLLYDTYQHVYGDQRVDADTVLANMGTYSASALSAKKEIEKKTAAQTTDTCNSYKEVMNLANSTFAELQHPLEVLQLAHEDFKRRGHTYFNRIRWSAVFIISAVSAFIAIAVYLVYIYFFSTNFYNL